MIFFIKAISNLMSGSLNEGTSHWLMQRVSSVLLIPLTVMFVYIFVNNFDLGYEQNLLIYKEPFYAFCTFLFLSITLWHFKQGAQVVIEDYVHSIGMFQFLMKTNIIFFWIMNLLVLLTMGRIVIEHYWS